MLHDGSNFGMNSAKTAAGVFGQVRPAQISAGWGRGRAGRFPGRTFFRKFINRIFPGMFQPDFLENI
jgi:hypothetical protein